MNKIWTVLISVALAFLCAGCPPTATPTPTPTFKLVYAAENGEIAGINPQTVKKGLDGTEVEALAKEGYHFVKWSDGVATASRTDTDVQADISVRASFEPNWKTLDFPGATSTQVCGIHQGKVFGSYRDVSGIQHGFLYDIETESYATFDFPGAVSTEVCGIDGSNIAGSCWDNANPGWHGFLYDVEKKTYAAIDMPGATNTEVCGIDGSNIVVVCYNNPCMVSSFLYDGKNWVRLEKPGATNTEVCGISGNKIVGVYFDASGWHTFLYDIETESYVTIDKPEAISVEARGISGNKLVGVYSDDSHNSHGFLCDGESWTTIDKPGVTGYTCPIGISDNKIVGDCVDASGIQHGFLYTIPEP